MFRVCLKGPTASMLISVARVLISMQVKSVSRVRKPQ